jgi:hypothetical protein
MKLGTYSMPMYRLDTLLPDTKKIYERFRLEEIQVDHIASFLGLSPRSGGFLQKMADLRAYGLIEGRGGKSRVSKLGRDATLGIGAEKDRALEKIVKGIPLWGIFYEKYGKGIKVDDFWMDLEKITGMERLDSQKVAESVRKHYNDDAKYINIVETPQKPAEPENIKPRAEEAPDRIKNMSEIQLPTGEALVFIKYPSIGTITLDLNDETNLDIAETILTKIKNKLIKTDVKSTLSSTNPVSPTDSDNKT